MKDKVKSHAYEVTVKPFVLYAVKNEKGGLTFQSPSDYKLPCGVTQPSSHCASSFLGFFVFFGMRQGVFKIKVLPAEAGAERQKQEIEKGNRTGKEHGGRERDPFGRDNMAEKSIQGGRERHMAGTQWQGSWVKFRKLADCPSKKANNLILYRCLHAFTISPQKPSQYLAPKVGPKTQMRHEIQAKGTSPQPREHPDTYSDVRPGREPRHTCMEQRCD